MVTGGVGPATTAGHRQRSVSVLTSKSGTYWLEITVVFVCTQHTAFAYVLKTVTGEKNRSVKGLESKKETLPTLNPGANLRVGEEVKPAVLPE